MRIGDIFRKTALTPTRKPDTVTSNEENAFEEERRSSATNEDRITISSAARRYSKIGGIIAEEESDRQAKLEMIKGQIAAGEYSVSSTDVAKAILGYAGLDNFQGINKKG